MSRTVKRRELAALDIGEVWRPSTGTHAFYGRVYATAGTVRNRHRHPGWPARPSRSAKQQEDASGRSTDREGLASDIDKVGRDRRIAVTIPELGQGGIEIAAGRQANAPGD
jgi:hypothetical protein